MFKWLYNRKKRDTLSIVVSTYNNVEFLSECVESLMHSSRNLDYEILLGIDNCADTFKFVSKNKLFLNKQIKVYYFTKNVGPYIVKNTLAIKAKHDNILFFDSDDILLPPSAERIVQFLKMDDIVKFKFDNFKYNNKRNQTPSEMHALGAFGIKKRLFIQLGGFLGWQCAADTEFDERCKALGVKVCRTNARLFLRRYHDNNITRSKKTGIDSQLRSEYAEIILSKRKNNDWNTNKPPETFPCVRMNILRNVDLHYKNYNDEFIKLSIDNQFIYVNIKELRSKIKAKIDQSANEIFP